MPKKKTNELDSIIQKMVKDRIDQTVNDELAAIEGRLLETVSAGLQAAKKQIDECIRAGMARIERDLQATSKQAMDSCNEVLAGFDSQFKTLVRETHLERDGIVMELRKFEHAIEAKIAQVSPLSKDEMIQVLITALSAKKQ